MFFDMREHWDAIVIGAGMGGLTAALIWSRQDGL